MRDFSRKMMSIGAAVLAVGSLSACIDQSTAPSSNLVAAPAAPAAPAVDPFAGCPTLAADSVWKSRVVNLPIDVNSAKYKAALGGANTKLGVAVSSRIWQGSRPGFPINVVDTRTGTVPMREVVYYEWGDISYKGRFPITDDVRVESDPLPMDWWVQRPSDDHILVVDKADCSMYELFKINTGLWAANRNLWASSGARWMLADGKTQGALPAGLGTNAALAPYAGITTRLAEVQRGRIDHMIGACTNMASPKATWPARSSDGPSANPDAPPMGSRFRLKADRVARFTGQGKVFAQAMNEFGVMLYDTCGGSKFQITAENVASGWIDAELEPLKNLTMDDFDVVDQTPLKISDASWAVK